MTLNLYPRLIQRYGGDVLLKNMIKPCRKSRSHALVGTGTYEKYGYQLNYKTGWKKCLRERNEKTKPERDVNLEFKLRSSCDAKLSASELSMRESIFKALNSLRQPQFHESYRFTDSCGNYCDHIIGQGVEGTIRCAKAHNSTEIVAVKSINKIHNRMFPRKDSPLMREVTVLRRLHHPSIIKLVDVFESPVRLHIVTEYLAGGDLYNYLNERYFVLEDEEVAKRLMYKLLKAIEYCHDNDVVHLDIKLENVLRRTIGEDVGDIVLIDFGHSKDLPASNGSELLPTGSLALPVGSPSYAAPEIILEKKYNARSDLWSLGVLSYILLQGGLPFAHLQNKVWYKFDKEDYTSDENNPFCYPEDWECISPEALSFVQCLLKFHPEERISVAEAVAHPWFDSIVNPESISEAQSGYA